MDGSQQVDPLDELRRANPVAADDLRSANLARVRANVIGGIARENSSADAKASRTPRPLALGLAGLATTLVVAIGVLGLGIGPGPTPGQSDAPQIGFCIEAYSLETLRNRTFAFDGTVVAVAGDSVTFRVEAAFMGIEGDEVTVTATGMTGGAVTPGGGPALAAGERYLVAGDASFAWGCGFTQRYDPDIATQWAAALRR